MKRKRSTSSSNKIYVPVKKIFLDISIKTEVKKEEELEEEEEWNLINFLPIDIMNHLISYLTIYDYIKLIKLTTKKINQFISLRLDENILNSIEFSIMISKLGVSIQNYCDHNNKFYFNKKIKSLFSSLLKDVKITVSTKSLINDHRYIIKPNIKITNQDITDFNEVINYLKDYQNGYINENLEMGFIPTNKARSFLEFNHIKYRELFYVPSTLKQISEGQTFERFCSHHGLPCDFQKMQPISNSNIKIEKYSLNFFEFNDINLSLFDFIQKTDDEKVDSMKFPLLSTLIKNIYVMIEIGKNRSYCHFYDLFPEILSQFIIFRHFKQINGKQFTEKSRIEIEEKKNELKIFEKDYKLILDNKIFHLFNKFCVNK